MPFVTDPPSRVSPASSNGRLAAARPEGSGIRSVLTWTFALFNLARLFGYLPTMWAIQRDASQHALLALIVVYRP